MRNTGAHLNSHATKIRLQPTIRPRFGSCTPETQTTSSQLFILPIRFGFWVHEPTLNWPPVAKRNPVRFLRKGGRREEGAASHRPRARRARNLLLGWRRGRTPHSPGGKRGWAGRERELDAAADPAARGGDTKNLGSDYRPAGALPHPPCSKPPRNSRPGRRRSRQRRARRRAGLPAPPGEDRQRVRAETPGWRAARGLGGARDGREPPPPSPGPGRRIPAPASPHPPAS